MIPLISLIGLTLSLAILIIQFLRLDVINKVISGEYEINIGFLKLIIFKLKNTKDDTKGLGLFGEISSCCSDCFSKKDKDNDNDNKSD